MTKMRAVVLRRSLTCLLLGTVLTGCSWGPNYVTPTLDLPKSFTRGPAVIGDVTDDQILNAWWHA